MAMHDPIRLGRVKHPAQPPSPYTEKAWRCQERCVRYEISGNIAVCSGLWNNHEVTGESTAYKDFRIWRVP